MEVRYWGEENFYEPWKPIWVPGLRVVKGEVKVLPRNFLYVYERIYKEENAMLREFEKIPVNGKRTSAVDVKRIRKIISDSTYQVAQECQIILSYPCMHIEGQKVVLGEPTIMLPDCRLVNIEQLKDIELGRRK